MTEEYSKGCLMCTVKPEDSIRIIQEMIPKETLASDEDENGDIVNGLQKYLHTTVLYGFDSNLNTNELLPFLAPYRGITINVQRIEHFENDTTVCVLEIDSDLEKLHYELRENFPVNLTYKDYRQHITLAYLKKGEFLPAKIVSFKLQVDNFIFSTREGTHTTL